MCGEQSLDGLEGGFVLTLILLFKRLLDGGEVRGAATTGTFCRCRMDTVDRDREA